MPQTAAKESWNLPLAGFDQQLWSMQGARLVCAV
jgi:hypothetical protein